MSYVMDFETPDKVATDDMVCGLSMTCVISDMTKNPSLLQGCHHEC